MALRTRQYNHLFYRAGLGSILLCLSFTLCAAEPVFRISGASAEQQANIEAWLGTPREGCALPANRERSLQRNTRNDVNKAMQALGYYHADIQLSLKRSNDCWSMDIQLIANDPVRITQIDVQLSGSAEKDPAFAGLLNNIGIQPGDILRHDRYEQLKHDLVSLAAERGYFDSQLTQQALTVNPASDSAAIHLHLDSGPRYYFGAIRFEQDILNPGFLKKFVDFDEGDAFDNRKLLALRQALSSSGYFADVRVQALNDEADNLHVPVLVSANGRPQYVYSAGIGFATDTGPRLRLGVENRRVNRQGHRYSGELEVSPVRSGIGANYEIPLGNPNRDRINLGSSILHEESDDDKQSDLYRIRIAHLRELDSGWIATRSLDFEREYFTVASQKDRTDLIMPGYELTRVKADNPVYPQRGWKLNGSVRFAHQALASSASFVQLRGLAKWIFPVWYGRVLMRLEAGVTLADEVTDLPASVRFFAGGDSSIRGYAYQSLGPEDASGDVIGGRHLLTGSIEYDFPVADRWSLAVFTDAGNAFDRWQSVKMVSGSGAGVRWRSPIGPIRLDLAHPSDGNDSIRIHISMGMDL